MLYNNVKDFTWEHIPMIDDTSKPALEILQPDWDQIKPANIDALMTLRSGGVSSGPFGDQTGVGGFNVGLYTGDVSFCIKMNRDLAAQLVPSNPKWLKQVHGTEVVDAETASEEVEADASVSVTPGVVCVVQVADCLPVVLTDTQGRVVAAVHCGWRSLAGGILQKTVQRMRERICDDQASFIAWCGPRIGEENFEVGEDVLEAMQTMLPDASSAFKPNENGRYHASLVKLAQMALAQVNVNQIVVAKHNTYADAQKFYSYRRDGKTGRHAVMVWIKES